MVASKLDAALLEYNQMLASSLESQVHNSAVKMHIYIYSIIFIYCTHIIPNLC